MRLDSYDSTFSYIMAYVGLFIRVPVDGVEFRVFWRHVRVMAFILRVILSKFALLVQTCYTLAWFLSYLTKNWG